MIRIYNTIEKYRIRLYRTYNLIFFAVFLFVSCNRDGSAGLNLIWDKNDRASAMLIPEDMLSSVPADSVKYLLAIRLATDSTHTDVLGDYKITDEGIVFEPLIPLSRGMKYEVLLRNKLISDIEIPLADPAQAPALLAVYPTQNVLPENLLKIYLQFSKPMREGESQRYVSLVKNDRDTLKDVFLDLQPELWNEDRTVLTLWLDPGRIKRDLQPNKRLGNPLAKGERYKLIISDQWKDVQNLPLRQTFTKEFIASFRDSLSPDPNRWTLKVPQQNTKQPFAIDLKEPLDYFLLQETLKILDSNGRALAGKFQISNEEKQLMFIPGDPWRSGRYVLQIQTYLEDLAGNNINRPFDRDLMNSRTPKTDAFFERPFTIK